MHPRRLLVGALLTTLTTPVLAAAGPVKVVTSIPDFAVIATAIGGGEVEAESIVKGNRDVHGVELLPSFFVKIRRADVYAKVGLDLDLWAQQLIDGSRNATLVVVDVSKHIQPIEVPTFKVDASHGDLHRHGNPHYWLDPLATRAIADALLEGLVRVRPEAAERFRANADAYVTQIEAATVRWKEQLAPFAGTRVISFHNSWPYFAQRFDLIVVDFLEPKPGVPPTPSHVAELQALLDSGSVKAILMESYFDDRVPKMLERTTGTPLVKVPVLVGAAPGSDTREKLFDTIVSFLAQALSGAGK